MIRMTPLDAAPVRLTADAAEERLDLFLARTLGLTRAAVQRLIARGGVRLQERAARPATRLAVGETVVVTLQRDRSTTLVPERRPLRIVYEDADLLAIDKPAGLTVHPGAGRQSGTLANALGGLGVELSAAGGWHRPGLVHRLDRETSGLILVAKHDAAHAALARQFAERRVRKIYLALVSPPPRPADGAIDAPIGRDPTNRLRMAVAGGGKPAHTRYHTLGVHADLALLAVMPLTGRTHQIRVHLAAIGSPVRGDELYGGLRGPAPRLWLHAWRLSFRRPGDGAAIELEAPPPVELLAPLPDIAPLLERARAWSAQQPTSEC
jgi:23S rRNA pseudouridine1911/1915/1917 synthase